MLLVVDVGNTHVTLGVYSGARLAAHWRISSAGARTVDECLITIRMLLQLEKLNLEDLQACAISSVVPDLTPVFRSLAEETLGISTLVVSSNLDTGISILYDDPSSVGADRICNAVAGIQKYGGPLIVIDFGTATTFDVVSDKREYVGGVIAPGVESSSYILHKYAARLPKIELAFPTSVIGRTTEASMQAGIMFGTVELVNGLVRRLQAELQGKPTLIATGGLAKRLHGKIEQDPILEPNLTLEGLRLIYQRNAEQVQ